MQAAHFDGIILACLADDKGWAPDAKTWLFREGISGLNRKTFLHGHD
jgi:hypothetical protein